MIAQETSRTVHFKETGLPVNVEFPAHQPISPSALRYIESYEQALAGQNGTPLPGTTAFDVQMDYVGKIAAQMERTNGSFKDASLEIVRQTDPFTLPLIPEFSPIPLRSTDIIRSPIHRTLILPEFSPLFADPMETVQYESDTVILGSDLNAARVFYGPNTMNTYAEADVVASLVQNNAGMVDDNYVAHAQAWSGVFTLNEALQAYNDFEKEIPNSQVLTDVRQLFSLPHLDEEAPLLDHRFFASSFIEKWQNQVPLRKQGMLVVDMINHHLGQYYTQMTSSPAQASGN